MMLLDASVLSKVVEMLFQVGTPVVSLFVMWLAHRLVKVFEDKSGVAVPAQYDAMIDDWVKKGVMYAEEKGRAAANAKLADVKGPDKLELAANFVLDMVNKYDLPDMARDKVEKLIESKLMAERVDPANSAINLK